jgi:dethiobiotin synthetase
MKLAGPPTSRSSSAPTRTTINSGRLDEWLNNGVPHLGQKRRRMVFPLSAVLMYSPTSPVSVKPSVLKIALIDALPAARYWQSRHQQARTAMGAWSNWKRTVPQKQRPVMGFVIVITPDRNPVRNTSKLDRPVKPWDCKAMRAFFVTATGTDIGKTYLGCGLIRAWRERGLRVGAFKPVLSGFDPANAAESDAGQLLSALGEKLSPQSLEAISPWRYAAPLSPDAAAAKEGKRVEYESVLAASSRFLEGAHDVAMIEGAGGVMAPLSEDRTMLDWIAELKLPAILVVGSYLGTLSHSLTALSVLAARRVPVALVVMNETTGSTVPLAENAAALARRWPAAPVRALPRSASPQTMAAMAELLSAG